jgi:hypothetical protein
MWTACSGSAESEAVMITTRNVLWIVALGSAWGVAEVFGEDLLAGIGAPGASIWLAAWAVFMLSIGRGVWNRIGSSAVIGLVAASLKYLGPSPDYCHLLGIASLGVLFDVFASGLVSRGRSGWWRHALVGLLTAYGSGTFFVMYSVHIAHFERWVDGGTQMALDHVLRSGSVVALAAVLLAPLGFRIGGKAGEAPAGNPAEDHLDAVAT